YGPQNDVTLKMPAFEWVHVQLHQQKGMISLSPPTICNSAIKTAVEMQMFEPEAYAGKMCTVRISIQRDGTLNSAIAEGGDPKLCKAAISAVTHAKIPPAPDENTWQIFKNAPLDFRP
ncbi:cell envelope integrity protein TolA, partial [Klebsiella pneumoniae]